MAVTSGTQTATTAASWIPELWVDATLEAVEFSAVWQKRVSRQFEQFATVGNTFDVRRGANLTTQTKSTGLANTISWETTTEQKQQITVSTVEYAAFMIEDPAKAQIMGDFQGHYSNKIGYALTRGREVTLAALPASLASHTAIGVLANELTSDDYLAAYQDMITAGLMEDDLTADENFSVILSPQAWVAALKVDVFTNRQYNTKGDAIQRASIGNIYSFPVYVSNLTKSNGGGHDCVMMHRGCFALVVQKEVNVVSSYVIESIGTGVLGWNLYGTAELNYPPEAVTSGDPGTYTAVDNRGVHLKTV